MYCGIDVIEVDRIKEAINRTEKFKENIFSINEIKEIEKCSEKLRYQRYAGRFAAKEAVFKAISKILIEQNLTIELKDIEILNDIRLKNRPFVNILNDNANNILKLWSIDVSISHIEQIAMAQCIVNKK